MSHDPETSGAGDPVLRHETPIGEPEIVSGDPELIEAVSAHVERHLGPVHRVFHEIVSPGVHLDVHWVAPDRGRPYHSLVTSGMSERPMAVPPGLADQAYAELMVSLPASWPLSMEAFEDEASYWPIRTLKQLARMPHEYGTWLGFGHTVGNGEPPQPYAPNTELCGVIVLPPLQAGEKFFTLRRSRVRSWLRGSGRSRTIHFWSLVPVYREEMELKLREGADALLDLFDREGVTEVIDPHRKNVARSASSGSSGHDPAS